MKLSLSSNLSRFLVVLGTVSSTLLALPGRTHAGDACEPELVSSTPGGSSEFVVVDGPHAFVPVGAGFSIFDISDPTNPVLVTSWAQLPSGPNAMDVDDEYAYLPGFNQFFVVDLHDIVAPVLVGEVSVSFGSSVPDGITVVGDTVYVASGNGLAIIDVSNPADPVVISSGTGMGGMDVDVVGTTAFFASRFEGWFAYDVSDPSAPVLLDSYPMDFLFGATIVDGIAYLGAGTDGIHILDVSDPTDLTFLGSTLTGGFAAMPAFSNGLVYLAADALGMQVIDVSEPASPFLVDSISFSNYCLHLEHVNGYVAARLIGSLEMVDVRTCGAPFITTHPQSTVVSPPDLATFTVIADGESLSYQWRADGVALADGGIFSGTQTPTLTVSATITAIGVYDCVVSNTFGEATSDPAVLAVTTNCPEDLDGSTVVGFGDLLQLLSAWGGCP